MKGGGLSGPYLFKPNPDKGSNQTKPLPERINQVGEIMAQMRVYTELSSIPEHLHDALRAGFGFFECQLRMRHKWGHPVSGPYSVSVKESSFQKSTTEDTRYDIKWFTGPDRPAVQFRPKPQPIGAPPSQISIGYIVDDPGWYNRILLAENHPYVCTGYHSNKGYMPISAFHTWFDAIREVLFESKKRYVVIGNTGRRLQSFLKEADALDFSKTPDDDHPGRMLYPRSKVFAEEYIDKTSEILKIIRENRTILHGWPASDEFRNIVRPRIQKIIDERMEAPETQQRNFTLAQIAAMSPEERKALKEILFQGDDVSRETRVDISSVGITRKTLEVHAKNIGIENPETIPNKLALIDAIVIKQDGDRTIPGKVEPIEKELVT
jgi:hypothetical protein